MPATGSATILRKETGHAVGVLLAAAVLALASVRAARALEPAAMLWLGNGLLLALALRRPRAARGWLPLGLLAGLGVRGALGTPWALAAAFTAADALELGLLCAAFGVFRRDAAPKPDDPRPTLLAGALLAPLPAAVLAAYCAGTLSDVALDATARGWWLGHAAGLLAVPPLALAWSAPAWRALRTRAVGVLAALAIAVGIAWLLPIHAAAVLLIAPLVLATGRWLGGLGAALGLVAAQVAGIAWMMASGAPVLTPLLPAAPLQMGLAVAVVGFGPWCATVLRERSGHASAQAALADARLQAVVAHAPVLVARIDRDLRLREANAAWWRWLGREADAAPGRRLHELFEAADAQRLTSRLQRAFAGQAQGFELTLADGRALQLQLQPDFDEHGALAGALLFGEDRGWRRQAGQQFDELLAAGGPALLLDADGRVAQANDAATRLFGMERELLRQLPAEQLFAAPARPLVAGALARARGGVPAQLDSLEARAGSGGRLLLDLHCTRLQRDGQALVLAVLRDASLAFELAAALEQAQAAAHATLHAVADAVVACDAMRRITAFNPAAAELTGWTAEEAFGQPVQQVLRLAREEGGAPAPLPLEVALADNRAAVAQEAVLLLRRNGSRLPVQASAQPLRDAAGGVAGGVMALRQHNDVQAMAQKMSHLAQHDYLTDLPNRVLLQDRLSQALATIDRGGKGALLFLDLDFFKQINDSIGHHAGDRVLQEVARRLKENVRADDTVSRQGGDEFVLLLVRLADPRDAARVAEKLIQAIEQPIDFEGQALRVSASIGIALFPQDARDIQTLMKQADTALYHAKEAGRGRYSYFTGIMSARAEQRMRMEHDLRFALANEDLFLAFQPKVTLPEGHITGIEALVRWRRCDTGEVVPPGEFIPLAEEIGLITAIDEWVMAEACRQNRAWQDGGLPAIPVSVNVSLARFDPERLLAQVARVLEDTGLAPQWLEIEFTESQMFGQLERAQALITELKALGVQVAIDDFGTGYSGLSYLMRYRFDALKIDRSFVQGLPDDPRNTAIVQAIVAMARALDYRVVAEGVETSAQADALAAYGCSEMQGFLYGRPLPACEFAALLRRGAVGALEHEAFPRRA